MSYAYSCYPETVKKSNKSTLELVNALNEAGYIRQDINSSSFCIGRLYRIVFRDTIDAAMMPANLDDLYITAVEKVSNSETIYYPDYRMGNEKYESFENPTYELFDAVKWSLWTRLTEREYDVLAYRLGFEDGNSHSLEQTGQEFCITRERVRQIVAKALRKLKRKNTLPTIVSSSDEQRAETVSAEEAAEHLDGGILDHSDIEQLGLSVRAYYCLKRFAQINTVEDILNYPKEDWPKIKNLGRKATLEIQDKMRAVGYPDFSINLS